VAFIFIVRAGFYGQICVRKIFMAQRLLRDSNYCSSWLWSCFYYHEKSIFVL